mmetsp:Transcript_70583/g.195059  ORF Transcript_70583/g.195059 Transcript_70583/m.195059 type:complete len:111 (+) Transcript_70583:124-456(+)
MATQPAKRFRRSGAGEAARTLVARDGGQRAWPQWRGWPHALKGCRTATREAVQPSKQQSRTPWSVLNQALALATVIKCTSVGVSNAGTGPPLSSVATQLPGRLPGQPPEW